MTFIETERSAEKTCIDPYIIFGVQMHHEK